ncbi:MAG: hypothetical protein ACOWWO_06795 [Peptococcaceae bacterium]
MEFQFGTNWSEYSRFGGDFHRNADFSCPGDAGGNLL